jgi:predicted DNA-binding protein
VVEQLAVYDYLEHTDDGVNNVREGHSMKEMNDLYIRMAVDDRCRRGSEDNVRGNRDHRYGLDVEMNDLYIRMAVDDRCHRGGEDNVHGDHDHRCGLGVEMNDLYIRMAVDDRCHRGGEDNVRGDHVHGYGLCVEEMNDLHVHDGENNVGGNHDHICSHGNYSVLPCLLKVVREVRSYFLVGPVLPE